jgi:class 3 adenylate cyclase
MKRKIAAILAADAAEYSRLVAEDEEETLRQLVASVGVFRASVEAHGGRIFNTAGDAVLAEFQSAVEAVRSAIDIQEKLKVRNEGYASNRRMMFRMGISIGDVVENEGDLLGDGVNIAARLQGLAQPGGLAISRWVQEQVAGKVTAEFRDAGHQLVRNMPAPIHVYKSSIAPAVRADVDATRAAAPPTAPGRGWRFGSMAAGVAVVTVAVAFAAMPRNDPAPPAVQDILTPSAKQENAAPSIAAPAEPSPSQAALSPPQTLEPALPERNPLPKIEPVAVETPTPAPVESSAAPPSPATSPAIASSQPEPSSATPPPATALTEPTPSLAAPPPATALTEPTPSLAAPPAATALTEPAPSPELPPATARAEPTPSPLASPPVAAFTPPAATDLPVVSAPEPTRTIFPPVPLARENGQPGELRLSNPAPAPQFKPTPSVSTPPPPVTAQQEGPADRKRQKVQCAEVLERAQLGDITADDRTFLRDKCRGVHQ